MHLINTDTLELAEFHSTKDDDGNPLQYAILSHTWGREEVSFEEWSCAFRTSRSSAFTIWTALQSVVGPQVLTGIMQKPGYRKIRAAARIAAIAGYKWLWVDTCCINKTSSAELSENINSMFRYYASAGVCYAYLEDVEMASFVSPRSLYSSKWFTRGWTLQELLAPQNVVFFDRNWEEIGDKTSLADEISQITGIPVDSLETSENLYHLSVAERMSWASSRDVTREEDEAYCLFGIFGVHMPLLYGEGRFGAFRRLQVEIMRTTTDGSIFAFHKNTHIGGPGLLASSVKEFKDSGGVRAAPIKSGLYHWRFSSSVVNNMIRLRVLIRKAEISKHGVNNTFPLYCYREDLFEILLNCANDDGPVTMLLQQHSQEEYVRWNYMLLLPSITTKVWDEEAWKDLIACFEFKEILILI